MQGKLQLSRDFLYFNFNQSHNKFSLINRKLYVSILGRVYKHINMSYTNAIKCTFTGLSLGTALSRHCTRVLLTRAHFKLKDSALTGILIEQSELFQ